MNDQANGDTETTENDFILIRKEPPGPEATWRIHKANYRVKETTCVNSSACRCEYTTVKAGPGGEINALCCCGIIHSGEIQKHLCISQLKRIDKETVRICILEYFPAFKNGLKGGVFQWWEHGGAGQPSG